MKKLILALSVLAALLSAAACAEAAALPEFEVKLNGTAVNSEYREYPLLCYNGITYFPLTYYDCRFMGLTTEWDNDTRTLYIDKDNISGMYRDYACETRNDYFQDAWIYGAKIVINGEEINNFKEEYPFLILRNVTYLPLTWRFAHDEFGWEYSYTQEDGLVINADNYHTEILDLPNFTGCSVATDGEYYFYQGGQDIYRTPVDDTSACEVIYTMPLPPYFDGAERDGSTALPAEFSYKYGEVRMSFRDFDTATFTQYYELKYDPETNTFVKDDKPASTNNSVGPNTSYYYFDGIRVSRFIDGVTYERNGEAVSLLGKLSVLGALRGVGHNLYVSGTLAGETESAIYKVDMDTNEITRVTDAADSFFAFSGWSNASRGMCDMLLFSRDGSVWRWQSDTGEIMESVHFSEELPPLIMAANSGQNILLAFKDENGLDIIMRDSYGIGSIQNIMFSTSTSASVYELEDAVYVTVYDEVPGEDARFVVFGKGGMDFIPYISSDMPDNVFINGNILIYTVDDRVVKVELGRSGEYMGKMF